MRLNGYTAANEVFVALQDPAGVPNYYRWDWKLWEHQDWCLPGQYADLYCSSSVSRVYYWLERTGNSGRPIGLFQALYGRQPLFSPLPGVPCVSDENRTPVKPEGWRE